MIHDKANVLPAALRCLLLSTGALAAPAAGEMHISEAGVEFIKSFEGFSPTVHEDTTGWAIGYGTQCGEFDYPLGITEEQGEELMRADLASMEASLNASLASMGITLEQHEYDALVSFTYNLGIGWLGSDYQIYAMLSSGHGRLQRRRRGQHLRPLLPRGLRDQRRAAAAAAGGGKTVPLWRLPFGGTPRMSTAIRPRPTGDYRLLEPTGELTASPFNDLDYKRLVLQIRGPAGLVRLHRGPRRGRF